MADISASNWSETDASNNSSAPDGFPENMAPSGVNDGMRAVMGAVKRWWDRINGTLTSTGSANAYVLTYTVAPTAYVMGARYCFKSNFANTSAATININSLGAKTIKRIDGSDLSANDILNGQMVDLVYDGTNMQLLGRVGNWVSQSGAEIFAADAQGSDTYVITLTPAPTAYATGNVYHFTANTVNTGAATLNVNSLGAKTIKKNKDQDLADGDIKAGQLVTVAYDGTNFQLESPVAGYGWELLAVKTASNSATIDFTSECDTTRYDDFVVIIDEATLQSGASANFYMRLSQSATFATSGYYYGGRLMTSGASAADIVGSAAGQMRLCANFDTTAGNCAHGEVFVHKLASTVQTACRWSMVVRDTGGGAEWEQGAGFHQSSSAHDGIRFYMSTGNIGAGKFKLYGVRR